MVDDNGARRWAERAKAAAQQHPVEPPAPAGAREAQTVESHKRRLFAGPPAQAAEPSGINPFLPGPARPTGDDEEDLDVEPSNEGRGGGLATLGLDHVSGPTGPPLAPAPLNPALSVPQSWPTAPAAPGPLGTVVQLVGLHGGAGTSTLAALLGPLAVDCGASLDNLATLDVPVLFVTRTHAHGLDLALRIGQQYAARSLGPVRVLGICVVHDAPNLSKGLARTLRSVEKTLPNCWIVPWDEDLRHDPALPSAASHGRMARDVRRILKKAAQLRESREPPQQTQTRTAAIHRNK